jgi:hypothetical protein
VVVMRVRGLTVGLGVGLFGLIVMTAGCELEHAPWYGFELLPAVDAGSAPSEQMQPASTPAMDTPVSSADPAAQAPIAVTAGTASLAAGSGGTLASAAPVVTAAGEGAPPTASVAAPATTAFRITELYLRDPHIFVGAADLTEQPVLGMSLNRSIIPNQLSMDANQDGLLDLSIMLLMRPFDALASAASLSVVNANCPQNQLGPCTNIAGAPQASWPLDIRATGTCLTPLPNTTSGYQPAVGVPQAPCFLSANGQDLSIDLGGVSIQVIATRVSATYQTAPSAALIAGLIAGFVTNAAAMRAILPMNLGAQLAGNPLSNYVRQQDHDLASSPNMQDGFWMYLNFVAKPIDYTP